MIRRQGSIARRRNLNDMRKFRVPANWICLLLAAWLMAACTAEYEQELVPPRAPVSHIGVIAVAPFANLSSDPGLASALAAAIADRIGRSGWYEVRGPEAVQAAMLSADYTIEELALPSAAAEIIEAVGADALITGSTDYYFEDVSMDPPRNRVWSTSEVGDWRSVQVTVVSVQMSGRLIDASEQVLHARRATGSGVVRDEIRIHWTGMDPPGSALIPRPSRRAVPEAREAAVQNAAEDFLADLFPTYIRRRVTD